MISVRHQVAARLLVTCIFPAPCGFIVPLAAAAQAPVHFYYCMANAKEPRAFYLTAIFSAAADPRDVNSAWTRYLEEKGVNAGQAATCQQGDTANLKQLMGISRQAISDNRGPRIVESEWKFSSDAVPASKPGMLYGYCQSGTSVANATYFSDVFPMSLQDAMARGEVVPFFQYVRAKYGDPAGLAVGPGWGPNGEWCMMIGNIADTERDKKNWESKLKSPTRQIVETGWRYGMTPAPAAASAASPPAAPAAAATGPVASTSTSPGRSYYCSASSADRVFNYFTRVLPADGADDRDIRSAWQQYISLSHTPGVIETKGAFACEVAETRIVQSNLEVRKKTINPQAHIVEVDWKYTPDQLAVVSKPGATYGFCLYANAVKHLTYMSGVFEIPQADLQSGNQVIQQEFLQYLRKNYGFAPEPGDVARSGGCSNHGNPTETESDRQHFETTVRQGSGQVVETGWKFVRTAQTPPAGPPVMSH